MNTDTPASAEEAMLNAGLLTCLQQDGVMVSLKDMASGTYRWANETMLAFLGVSSVEQIVGRTDGQLIVSLADVQAIKTADQRAATAAPSVSRGEHRFERGGRVLDFGTQRVVMAAAGRPGVLLSLWTDQTRQRRDSVELQRALAQIERHQADYEQLRRERSQGLDRPADLFRREHFEEHLRREVALSQREQREFALLLLAVDRLDQLQFAVGEGVVHRVSEAMNQVLRGGTRAMDVLAQLGPDRYAVLLSGVGLATAYSRAEHLRKACAAQLIVHDGRSFGFEVTVGVAAFPHSADTLDGLSQATIRALQRARASGGNRVAMATMSLA